ncbi:hypothetical protein C4D60_Mb05t08340 [Musa balbisiana]|uniref:Protein EARLY FLOWERING 3 n=1 Tax=Musa balbisiana TaxID=52838 RepID=A0A4V4H811_MUSBA|nr:hypothetical protein C4D60_Mb05t08340 [Musa balbisiana]
MKGAKDDDRVMGPLFPRLHVNDADKGGPRAPPRNKMALYEQFSVPSQRFNPASSTLPFPPRNSSNLVPSLPSSQGCGNRNNMFSPLYMTPRVPVHSAEVINSQTSDRMNSIATRMEFERKSIKQTSSGNLFGTGSAAAECSSQRPCNPNVKKSRGKMLDDVDDIVVPTFDQSEVLASLKKDAHMTDAGKLSTLSSWQTHKSPAAIEFSVQCPNSNEKPLGQTDSIETKSKNSIINRFGKNSKETSLIEEPKETKENSASHRAAERLSSSKDCLVRDKTGNLHVTEKSVNGNPELSQENGNLNGCQTLNDLVLLNNAEAQRARSELCSEASPEKGQRTLNLSENCQKEGSGSLEYGDAVRQDVTSEPSMVDTVSWLGISPDDIVGVIGPKHFWKARRAIINQQRVFAIQVFELHRLIKVQKLMAASPHLLLEGNPYISRSPVEAPSKNLFRQGNTTSQPEEFRPKDDHQKPKQNVEQPPEDISGIPALPACEDGPKGGSQGQVPKVGPNSGYLSPVPVTPDDKSSPWCFPPLANQWLVPVMSPSEGLVYKPYMGPCPPTGGFMTPHGSCTTLGMSHVAGDFINSAYGVPASHRPPNMGVMSGPPAIVPHYFPTPYGLQALNPLISTSAVEQVSNLAGSQPNGQTGQCSRSSCNTSHHPKEAFSGHRGKFRESKNSELQGSTASSPAEKAQPNGRSTSPLLSTALAANNHNCPSQSSGRDSCTRVIKVVPHNARSATESAARIFRSIQEERQQHDS